MFTKTSKPQNRIDSLIGMTTRIEGNVIFSGGLRVDGMVRGNVAALADQPGTLVVNDPAAVRNAPEKILVTHFPDLMPRTLITFATDQVPSMATLPLDFSRTFQFPLHALPANSPLRAG